MTNYHWDGHEWTEQPRTPPPERSGQGVLGTLTVIALLVLLSLAGCVYVMGIVGGAAFRGL